MCGRYLFLSEKNERLKALAEAAKEKLKKEQFEKISLYEVFPGSISFAGIYDPVKKNTVTRLMRWGYSKTDGRRIINARSETCFSSPFFAGSLPCALPASAYYEWSKDKVRHAFCTDEETFYLAGICRMKNNEYEFAVLTEEAQGKCAEIHNRQPVIFNYENAKKWCASDTPWILLEHSVQNRFFEKA